MLQRRLVRLATFPDLAYFFDLSGSRRHSEGMHPYLNSLKSAPPGLTEPHLSSMWMSVNTWRSSARNSSSLSSTSPLASALTIGRLAPAYVPSRCQDYVFDGTSPPYLPSSVTNPVNLYGTTKRDGEMAVLSVQGTKSIVLRVPVL